MNYLGTSYWAKFYLANGKVFESDNFERELAILKYVEKKLDFFESMQDGLNSEDYTVLKVEIFSRDCFVKRIKKGD